MQNDFFRNISKVHIIKYDISGQTDVIYGTIGLVYMFPDPDAGVFGGLSQNTVLFSGIDQCNISIVGFRLLVKKFEDSLASGQCHNHTVELHTHLRDWHVETLVECKKTCKFSKGEPSETTQSHDTTDHGAEHITQISNLCIDGSKIVGVTVGIVSTVKQLIV